ncbi:UDP-3-O-(3-hydroxymyristoyl)glucosamine N-acyltransferase [Candidatus Sumerlaeota bacterium]|nr:UDP-3-O-(3-hydroxymyristoyl)glucosamine N-acyltransferase [Candidatus Sumerlaeota bacterium]
MPIPTETTLTYREAAQLAKGELALCKGAKEDQNIERLTSLADARPEDATFISSEKYAAQLSETRAGLALVPHSLELETSAMSLVRCDDVWAAVKAILEHLYRPQADSAGIAPSAMIADDVKRGANLSAGHNAVIESGATLGDNVRIGAGCYIGKGAQIGNHTVLHPNCIVMDFCEIGANCILHPGAVIGADGYKYEAIGGVPAKIPQVGVVIIEDEVEIGANTTIDRASFTETRIGRGTKIDNLVQIAHNCKIGRYCLIISQVGLAGSTTVGDGCILAGQVGCKDNIKIGDRAILAAQSGLMHNVPAGETWFGYPAQPLNDEMRQIALLRKLPEMHKAIREIQKKLKNVQ